jgi:putative intracellular protease/amidase
LKTNQSTHPVREQLIQFALGKLDATTQAEIERHVAGCESCCRVVLAVPEDSLVQRLRSDETAIANADTDPQPAQIDKTSAAAPTPQIPVELIDHPRYRIVKLLGTGGMGQVFQAEHKLMERLVALKVINPRLLSNPEALGRFQLEVKAAAKLSHPNIVTAHDAEQAGGVHFLVMEFVDGVDLARLVQQRGALPVKSACHYIRQAALGLEHAFQRGMVHRDIKPQNLMLTRTGQIKLLDFGLARFARDQAAGGTTASGSSSGPPATMTMAGMVLGTPDYIAPEQVFDSRQADIRSDIYSLGCTLYFLLTGQAPFPPGSVTQKLNWHQTNAPRPMKDSRRDLPVELVATVERMMDKDPAKRFQTPAEVALALAPWVKGAVAGATPTAAGAKALVHRHRTKLAIASGAAILFGAAAVWLFQHFGRNSDAVQDSGKSIATAAVAANGDGKPDAKKAASPGLVKPRTGKRRVVIVIAHDGFFNPDYEPVRKKLEESGNVLVGVASSSLDGPARPNAYNQGKAADGQPVVPDVLLSRVRAEEIDAVIFTGGHVVEFMGNTESAASARKLVTEMLDSGKIVASLCQGTNILAETGVLDGRQAAKNSFILPQIRESCRAKWREQQVVVDGRLITGRDFHDATAFAEVVLRELE